jgi:hypothetical protein
MPTSRNIGGGAATNGGKILHQADDVSSSVGVVIGAVTGSLFSNAMPDRTTKHELDE